MNAERLLELYDRIADAPDAVDRLRRFVLDLAVRGKLVEQDPTDRPAEILPKPPGANRELRHDYPIGSAESSSESPESLPFTLPPKWVSTPLNSIVRVVNGRGYKKSELLDSGTPVLRVGNLFTSKLWYYSNLELDRDKYCDDGDLIYAWSASFGPFIWNGPRVIFHYHIWKLSILRPDAVDKHYLYYFLLQKTREIKLEGHGISMAHMTKRKMERLLISLPPLAEQHRIVAKVDELIGLCEQLEKTRGKRETTRDRLTAATLTRLTTTDTDEETFRSQARFALNTLPALTTRPDQIKALRQTILDLAVRGSLSARDLEDEPAEKLLTRITSERNRLIRSGAIRKSSTRPVLPHEVPFSIPGNWIWTRLGAIGDWGSGSTPSRNDPKNYGGGISWLKSGELNDSLYLTGSSETITDFALSHGAFRRNTSGDILIAMYGATIGKLAILGESAVTNQAVCGCTPFTGVLNRYLFLYLLSQRQVLKTSSEGGAQPNISKIKIVNNLFPLPPINEQHRIVIKVDELLALCDRLNASLKQADDKRALLLESLLAEALAPANRNQEAA